MLILFFLLILFKGLSYFVTYNIPVAKKTRLLGLNSPELNTAYECGFMALDRPNKKFNIHFFLVGALFVIFDLELVYFVIWSYNLLDVKWAGHFFFFEFIFVLLLGFVFESTLSMFFW